MNRIKPRQVDLLYLPCDRQLFQTYRILQKFPKDLFENGTLMILLIRTLLTKVLARAERTSKGDKPMWFSLLLMQIFKHVQLDTVEAIWFQMLLIPIANEIIFFSIKKWECLHISILLEKCCVISRIFTIIIFCLKKGGSTFSIL